MPKFFLPGQLVKIPCATAAAGDVADYMVAKVNTVSFRVALKVPLDRAFI